MNLNEHPRIIGLANALELSGQDAVDEIRQYCRGKVERFVRRAKKATNVRELQRIVCACLNLTVHEVWTDEDLKELTSSYAAKGEIVFKTLPVLLSPDAFGIFIKLQQSASPRRLEFVAVIDCRGAKSLRRYWTLWHEIAHCLTAIEQYELPLRRTTVEALEKDPIEKLTDIIAGDFAFYAPLFEPLLKDELHRTGKLTFRGAERIRDNFCADASLSSTMNACVAATRTPILLVEAGLDFKKSEREQIAAGAVGIRPALRVLRAIPNNAARAEHLFIPRHLRVPSSSVIARVFSDGPFGVPAASTALEDLHEWTTSDGNSLQRLPVAIEARKSGDHVLALIAIAA